MDAQRLKVLAIDDNPDNLTTLQAVLGEALPGCALLTALNGADGIKLARAEDPDVILLDIVMPGMDGYSVCQKVKADPRLQAIPVIFLTALRSDRESRIKALDVGGEAFLTKPLDEPELIAQIRAMAKIKAANRLQKLEKEQLTKLVAERTQALNQELLERKWAEAARQDSCDAMQAILESTIDGYWLTDNQGRLLDVNPAYCQLSGYTREELLDMYISDLDAEESPTDAAQHLQRVIRNHGDKFEARHRRKDGSIWDAEASATFQDVGGGRFVAFLRDISARKAAQEQLLQSQKALAATTEMLERMSATAKVGGWELDLRTMKLLWSTEVFRIHELDPSVQPSLEQGIAFYAPEAQPTIRAAVQAGLDHATPWDLELPLITAKGRRLWVRAQGKAMLEKGKIIKLVGAFHDINDRKQAEQALLESKELFSLYLSHSPIYTYIKQVTPTESRVVLASNSFQEMLGLPGQDMVGKTMEQLFPAEFAAKITADDWAVTSRGQVLRLDEELNGRSYTTIKFPILQGGKTLLAGYTIDITERKQAAAAIQKSKQQYDDLVSKIPVGVYILRSTPAGEFSLDYASPRMAEIMDLPVESLLGDANLVSQAIHPEDRDGFIRLNLEGLQNHHPFDWKGRVLVQDAVKWLHIESSPEPLENGDVLWNGVVTDITERVTAEARIQGLTHLYLTLAQCNQAIVRAKDESQLFPEICRGAVLFGAMKMAWIGLADQAGQRVNPVASFGDDLHYLKDLQISLDEADPLGRGPTGTAMREGRPFWCQDFQNDPATAPWREQGAHSGWRSSAVLPLRRKGVVVGALNFYSGIVNGFDEDARNLLIEMAADISHALDTFEDERERARIEAKFHESELRYHTLVAWSPEVMAVHSDGILRYVNPAAVKLMGANSAQDLIGKPILELVHPDSQAIMLARVKESLERGLEAPMIEEKFIKLDGSVIDVEVKSTPITFDGAMAIQVAVRDITERKRADKALRASLREKEALLKEVHHRVKNNLQVITSLLNLEAGRSAHPDTKAAFLEMQNRIRSMAMLHETLYRSENLDRVDLPYYIKQLVTQLFHSVLASPDVIQLHLELAPASLALDQAVPCGLLLNELVSNCLKHAFPDGRKGQVRVELQAQEAGGRLRLRVSDNGVGLPPNFDQLRTTSLGLYLVSGLTEQLNGQLEITPGPGTGAAFQVTFSPNQPSES